MPSRKLILILVLSILIALSALQNGPILGLVAQSSTAPAAEWEKSYPGGEAVFQVIQTSDNGFAFIGTGWAHISYDPPILIKVDSLGNMEWNKTLKISALTEATDGGIAVVGGNFKNITLYKISLNGNSEWNQTYSDYNRYIPTQSVLIVRTNDGGYAIAADNFSGHVYSGDHEIGLYATLLIKTDSNGKIEWRNTYNISASDFLSFELRSIVQSSDSGYVLTGSATSKRNDTDFCIAKINSRGDLEWTKTFGRENNDDDANAIIETNDGGYVLAGWSHSFTTGLTDSKAWLVKTDSTGNLQWNKTYGGPDYGNANCVIQTSDGGLAFAGSRPRYVDGGGSGFWLVKTDINGNLQWDQTYFKGVGIAYSSDVNSLIETKDGSLVMAGFRTASPSSRGTYNLIKTEPVLPPPTPSPTPLPTSTPSIFLLASEPILLAFASAVLIGVSVVILLFYFRKRPQHLPFKQ